MYKHIHNSGFKKEQILLYGITSLPLQYFGIPVFVFTYIIRMLSFLKFIFFLHTLLLFQNSFYVWCSGIFVIEFSVIEIAGLLFPLLFEKTYSSFCELEAQLIEFTSEWVMRLLYEMVAVQFSFILSLFFIEHAKGQYISLQLNVAFILYIVGFLFSFFSFFHFP